jgi:hypothetical protein
MSNAILIGFAKRLDEDAALRRCAAAISGDKQQALAQLVRLAAEAGFVLDAAPLEAGYRELMERELGDSALEQITGGAVGPCFMPRPAQVRSFTTLMAKLVPTTFGLGAIGPCDVVGPCAVVGPCD